MSTTNKIKSDLRCMAHVIKSQEIPGQSGIVPKDSPVNCGEYTLQNASK
jgi:hypothetical protein